MAVPEGISQRSAVLAPQALHPVVWVAAGDDGRRRGAVQHCIRHNVKVAAAPEGNNSSRRRESSRGRRTF